MRFSITVINQPYIITQRLYITWLCYACTKSSHKLGKSWEAKTKVICKCIYCPSYWSETLIQTNTRFSWLSSVSFAPCGYRWNQSFFEINRTGHNFHNHSTSMKLQRYPANVCTPWIHWWSIYANNIWSTCTHLYWHKIKRRTHQHFKQSHHHSSITCNSKC